LGQQLDRILAQDADVGESTPFELKEQMTDPGAMDLYPEVSPLWVGFGHPGEGLTVAKTDLQIGRVAGLVVFCE